MKIELSPIQILEYIVAGIKNGKYEAAINIAQDYIDELKDREKELKIKEE